LCGCAKAGASGPGSLHTLLRTGRHPASQGTRA
jgi:hypothetical protein